MLSEQVAFTTTAPGPFTLAHTLGVIPGRALIELTSSGYVWFQPVRHGASNIYLMASNAGLTGYVLVTTAPSIY
jgi:hypothetical protein